MKKNLYYLCLLLGLFFGISMFTACGGDDDGDNGGSTGKTTGDNWEAPYEPLKFQGPKRVFGENLLSSFGVQNTLYEITYNSDNFVCKIKMRLLNGDGQYEDFIEYEVTYLDNQVTINGKDSHDSENVIKKYVITIGYNGFADTCSVVDYRTGYTEVWHCSYNGDILYNVLTVKEGYEKGKTLSWQDSNIIEYVMSSDEYQHYTYTNVSNVAGILITPHYYVEEFFPPELFYMGLLGKSTANLVKSFKHMDWDNYSGRYNPTQTGENSWTFDDVGRPIKCVYEVTIPAYPQNFTSTITYFWNYR